MEQEKEALESELMQKQALFHEEKALMTQLLTEAEQKQEQQNQETMCAFVCSFSISYLHFTGVI